MPAIVINKEEYEFLDSQRQLIPGTTKKLESFAVVVKRLLDVKKK